MRTTDPKPLSDYFNEGLQARQDGKGLHDNPYSAGSAKRREWNAGFCATVEGDDELSDESDGGVNRTPE